MPKSNRLTNTGCCMVHGCDSLGRIFCLCDTNLCGSSQQDVVEQGELAPEIKHAMIKSFDGAFCVQKMRFGLMSLCYTKATFSPKRWSTLRTG